MALVPRHREGNVSGHGTKVCVSRADDVFLLFQTTLTQRPYRWTRMVSSYTAVVWFSVLDREPTSSIEPYSIPPSDAGTSGVKVSDTADQVPGVHRMSPRISGFGSPRAVFNEPRRDYSSVPPSNLMVRPGTTPEHQYSRPLLPLAKFREFTSCPREVPASVVSAAV